MLYNINQFLSPRKWTIPLAGLIITAGVIGQHAKPVLSNQIETVQTSTLVTDLPLVSRNAVLQQRQIQGNDDKVSSPRTTVQLTESQKATKNAAVPATKFPKKDGVYLYGQSSQPNQVGQGYIVFQKRQNQVMGGLYMPSSEFSCFQGNVDSSGELAMTVTAPGQGGSEEVATTNIPPKLDIDQPMTYAYSVALQDYHKLNIISESDRRILQMCNQALDGGYRK
ncbi:hypothetical protein OGM63_28985 [Plectonema radiosum NIES-515]|uniref:Uncharacterized protein n=1 Tax=Plectonema radiosum NIES-515 TaxID=2986073 RepID=A0ABT3B7Z3_9CYAN|nr:hypothetical protein [Plectonema radiosum]MCV3217496.1 hypothetical protein [Plectonema radiosum NIES-515]